MNRRRLQLVLAFGLVSLLAAVGAAVATGGGGTFRETLTGYEEVPALSTPARGEFTARLNRSSDTVAWRLSYRGFESDVTQAHIHFAQEAVNGGISVWLCANNPPITTAPEGIQACPTRAGTISGVFGRDDVVGPSAQGIEPREWEEFLSAMRAERTYANVHTVTRTGGEIRAQLDDRGRRGDD